MKSFSKFGLLVAAAALMVPGVSNAGEAVKGWYAGVNGIGSFQTNNETTNRTDGLTDKLHYDAGWGASGEAGYAFSNNIRAEGEVAFRRSGDVTKVTGPNTGIDGGHLRNVSLMANGLYDFTNHTRFTPYLGVGAGVSTVRADALRTVDYRILDGERPAFAYQGIAGLSTRITDKWSVITDYRYFRTLDIDFNTNLGDRSRTENASHNVVVGFRYSFGSPAAPAPARAPAPAPVVAPAPAPAPVVAPAPAPAPVVAPQVKAPEAAPAPVVPAVPQSFLVFFDFDRDTLTPEAKRIIASAAQEFQSGKYVRVVVTGHTDTVGTAKYNQKLSVKRAKAVEAEFKKLGVLASVITAEGAGKNGLLVPTADGVREAQNRRAEIVLNK